MSVHQCKKNLKKQYYNMKAASQQGNYNIVAKVALQILKEYPYDEYALDAHYHCLCIDGRLDEAKDVLLFLINSKNNKRAKFALRNLFRLEFQLGNFERAYELLEEYKPLANFNDDVKHYELFLKYKIFGDISTTTYPLWYDYDIDEQIEHVINRHSYSSKEFGNSFSPDTDIRELFLSIKTQLQNTPRSAAFNAYFPLNYTYFNDLYFFKKPYCGHQLNKDAHYIKIVTPPFSKDIITMYPIRHLPIPNTIHDFKEEEEKEPVKVLTPSSQIEKFNKKWNRQ